MAKINKEDINQLSTVELVERIKEEKLHFRKMIFNHTVSPIENPKVLTETRKNIARLKTEFRKREIEEENKKD